MGRDRSHQRTGNSMFNITKLLVGFVYLPVIFQFILKIMTLYIIYYIIYNARKKGRKVLLSGKVERGRS